MLNLYGMLTVDKLKDVMDYTELRLADKNVLVTPEALALYEQRYMLVEEIKSLCEKAYGFVLHEPVKSHVPDKVTKYYKETGCVPVAYMPSKKLITVVYMPDVKHYEKEYPDNKTEYLPTTIYYYLNEYQRKYGVHAMLREIPAKTLFDLIIKEAVDIGASDITISSDRHNTSVYYDVRKKKVESAFIFSRDFITDLIKVITIKSPLDRGSRHPKAVGIDLNTDYRGRVMINYKFNGCYTITIRLLPNAAFDSDIESLNLTEATVGWLQDNVLDSEKGLRLFVGATSSGKNTTSLALLKKLVETGRYKVVSVEIPVEQELHGVEQIDCLAPEDFKANIQSLIRVNPDFVYITEIQDTTGAVTVEVTNTGKCVLSTLHANSVSDTISRLTDITGFEQDRIIQALHSIVYQELLRDEEKDCLYPRNRYVRFTRELKTKLYGKSLGEVVSILRDYEEGDVWTYTQLTGF